MTPDAPHADRTPRYVARTLEVARNDAELQALMPEPSVREAMTRPGLSYGEVIATALDGYAGRPALGTREYEIATDPATGHHRRNHLPRFSTITYGELHQRVKGLANAWRHHEQHRVAPGDFVCILGFTGTDFTTAELACVYTQAVSVPLQTTLAGADLDRIFTDTAAPTLVATVDDLMLAVRAARTHESIRSIIAIDYDDRVDDDRDRYEAARTELAREPSGATLTTLPELIAFGQTREWEPLPPSAEDDRRMACLLHSSGSTGTPKGAIITERIAKTNWDATYAIVPVVRVCFAPMNHFLGRTMVFLTLAHGGTAHFTVEPDMSTLFDDIRLARPTDIILFPRVAEMIHRHYLSEVARRTSAGEGDRDAVGTKVMDEMRTGFLGDRVSLMTIGSAPTTPAIKRFMKDCFQVSFAEGYGMTESGGGRLTMRDRILRPPVIDYKLRDVPELGYHTTDTPYPRGELCVKTEFDVPGYYKRPEATAALYDDDGYLCTGDIMEERGPDHVVYVDRRNDVLKLSQGEFVTVGALGTTFEDGSPVIHQIYVYGNSARPYLLAVVVPDIDVARSLLGTEPDDAGLKALIRSEIKRVAGAAKLRSFEVPRDFIIEMEPFSHENGLLSSVRKRMRPNLQRRYGDQLEELYAKSERKQNEELLAFKDAAGGTSVLDRVGRALEITLGIEGVDVAQPSTFTQLGGDSLGAVDFSMTIEDVFGVELPVNAILSPAGNPNRWAQAIEAALRHEQGGLTTFASVHGKAARRIHAEDLDIATLLDPRTLEQAPAAEPAAVSRQVLLTGANGFLGRFLCLEWLERLATTGGKLICLVRADDHAAARRRLDGVYEGDPELEERYRSLADGHLEVVVGDVAAARLGLDDTEFDRLADEVDRIVHPAALVNHMLDYEHLFGPNVAGTAELVRLALTGRQKRFDFVSSLAAARLTERRGGVDEDSPLLPTVVLVDHYAGGYAASKWAAEQLLHSAHRRFGLPVNVFRGDMMLAHRHYHGQINVPDTFTRLLYSVIMTGLAPRSFYRLDPDGSRPEAHYDGLPIDFVAAAVAGISTAPHRDIRTFHVVNHHADSVSLDTIVDWVESAGYPVERVAGHDQWMQRFEVKLRAMPEAQRQHSSLTVLGSVRHPYRAHEPVVGSRRFQDAVLGPAVGLEVPHVTEAFIHKNLDDMRRLGLIPEPARPRRVPCGVDARRDHV